MFMQVVGPLYMYLYSLYIHVYIYLLSSQKAPVQPGAQVQMNPPIVSIQLAPFLHGWVEQACSATNEIGCNKLPE